MAQVDPREDSCSAELVPETRLGHYVIRKKLGAGGMGDIYEAVDERLQRSVAIKILPAELTGDDQARRRFQWEAQAASALNHPNIVTVYDVGREAGIDFLAMEKVHGRTLRQIIGPRGMDVRAAISCATQIADALAAAHQAGIVHRDLKPGNVMVTERDLVKVLDFGLAKKATPFARAAPDEPTLTVSPSLTNAGLAVGTISYMSPEQAEAKEVDSRSDIFSFGCVLYEMLTGRRAFQGENKFSIGAALLSKEPPALHDLVPDIPRSLERIVETCLRKKPLDRWQNMADVKLLLENVRRELDETPPASSSAERRRIGWSAVLVAAVLGALAPLLAWRMTLKPSRETAPEPILRRVTSDSGLNDFPALSRDGKLIAFASDRSKQGNLDIWLHQIGGREPIRLTNDPADESDPAFSPDGTRIVFRSEKGGGGIYVVPALGGDSALLAPGGRNPRFSPDGRSVAYWTGGEGVTGSAVFLIDAGGGQPKPVHPEIDAATYPVWSPSGDELIVYGRKGKGSADETLDWWILPLGKGDPKKTGVLPQLKAQKLTDMRLSTQIRPTPLDWKYDGADRVLFAATLGDAANLWEIPLSRGLVSGPARSATRGPGLHTHAAWAKSDDVERLAFTDEELNFDIWTLSLDADRGVVRGEMKRITEDGASEWAPSVTWDGKKISFLVRQSGIWSLRTIDLASGAERTLLSSPVRLVNAKLAGDGSRIVYSTIENNLFSIPGGGGTAEQLCEGCGAVMGISFNAAWVTFEPVAFEDLMMFDSVSHRKVTLAPRQRPDVILSSGQFSRDGKWVAFHSVHNPTRTDQVWIAAVNPNRPAPPDEWIAITEANALGRNPCWAPNGNVLYFTSEQDGFRCIWARRLDPVTKKPAGDMFPVQHFHTARRSLRRIGNAGYLTGLSVGRDLMVFALGELTGNIWLEEKAR